ncbi:MAG: TolC family protein [Candidatus Methylacidiphilales bacterium]
MLILPPPARRWVSLLALGLAFQVCPAVTLPQTASKVPVYSLVEAVNLALQNNPELLQAQKRIEEAQGAKIEARAGFIPKLSTSGSYLRRESDYATSGGVNPNRSTEDWAINVRLIQNIYSGQGVRNRVAISKLLEQVRLLEYQAAVDRVVMEVRIVFDEILAARTAVEVRRQAVELLREEVKNQKARFDAGTVGELNVVRAEVSLANEFPALEEAQNRLKEGKIRLSQLLGLPYLLEQDAVPFDIQGQLTYRKTNFNLDECLAKAESLRPEIKARDLEIQVAEKQIIVERSNAMPRVDVFFGYDLFNETNTALDRDTVGGYITGVQGTWNIFDGFATKGRVDQARARAGSARAAREAARNTVFAEVRTAFLQLQQAEATVASQARNAVLARESFVLAQASFDAGLSSQLDILQARNDLTRAQLAELNAKLLHRAALARLERSIASQVQVVEDAPATPVPVRKTGPRAGSSSTPPPSSATPLAAHEDLERVLDRPVSAPTPERSPKQPANALPEPAETAKALTAGP